MQTQWQPIAPISRARRSVTETSRICPWRNVVGSRRCDRENLTFATLRRLARGFRPSVIVISLTAATQLFMECVRILCGLRPKVFLIENVSGMVKGDMKLLFVEYLRDMKAAGYRVRARLLDAKYFNVAQSRKRIIFVGIRNDLGIEPTHPRAQSSPLSVREALKLAGEGGIRSDNQYHKKDPWRSLDLPCRAITRHPPILLLDGHQRRLTVDECAVISGFPKNWQWGRSAYQMIANSVPPPLMRAIAEHVRDNVLAVMDAKAKRVN